MSNYNYVNRVLIGDGANSGTITSLPGIQKGDLVFLDESGNVISTNAASAALAKFEQVVIAAGIGPGKVILSSPIQGNHVSAYEGKAYRAPAEKVVYIGYDGSTAGTGLSVSASTEYRLRIHILDDHRFNGQRQTFMDYNYVGGASASEEDAVTEIICYFDQDDYVDGYMQDKVKLEAITDGTPTFYTGAEDPTFTKGSKTVTFASNVTIADGSWIRVRGVDYRVETGVTAGTEITLYHEYKGDSETIDVSVETTAVGTLASITEYGFKITALKQDAILSRTANEPFDQYEWINFDAYFSEADGRSFDSVATKTVATEVDPGNGYWRQVAEQEEAAKGYLGDTSKRRFHDKRIDSNVQVDVAYDTIVITHATVHRADFQDTYNAPLKTEIYIPDGGDQGLNSGDNFVHILNGFFSDVLGFPAISF